LLLRQRLFAVEIVLWQKSIAAESVFSGYILLPKFFAAVIICGGKGCGGVCCGGKHTWWECVRWLAKALVGNFDSTCQLLLGT